MHPRWSLLMAIGFIWTAPAFAYGATYYVAKTGSNNYTCTQAQSASTPRLTIHSGISCLSAGDTLIVKSGIYAEGINDTIPAGTSVSARTTIRAATGETVTIRPSAGIGPYSLHGVYITKSFIEFDGLIIDGVNVALPFRLNGTATGHLLQNSEVKSVKKASGGNCVTIQGSVTSSIVRNNKIHDCGDPADSLDHGVYLWNSGHIVENNEIYNITSHGIHVYHAGSLVSNNIVRYNHVHDTGSRGILIGSGDNNIAHNNIVVNSASQGIAVGFNTTTSNKVFNNTIYSSGSDCINIRSTATNTQVKNNLCLSNVNNTILNHGTGSIIANNKLTNTATLVVDATKTLFSPRTGSALIDAGEIISGFSGGKFLGLAPDHGAIEFVPAASAAIPHAPANLQINVQ